MLVAGETEAAGARLIEILRENPGLEAPGVLHPLPTMAGGIPEKRLALMSAAEAIVVRAITDRQTCARQNARWFRLSRAPDRCQYHAQYSMPALRTLALTLTPRYLQERRPLQEELRRNALGPLAHRSPRLGEHDVAHHPHSRAFGIPRRKSRHERFIPCGIGRRSQRHGRGNLVAAAGGSGHLGPRGRRRDDRPRSHRGARWRACRPPESAGYSGIRKSWCSPVLPPCGKYRCHAAATPARAALIHFPAPSRRPNRRFAAHRRSGTGHRPADASGRFRSRPANRRRRIPPGSPRNGSRYPSPGPAARRTHHRPG